MCKHNNKSFIGIVCENRIKIGKKCRQRNQFISILVRMFAEWWTFLIIHLMFLLRLTLKNAQSIRIIQMNVVFWR